VQLQAGRGGLGSDRVGGEFHRLTPVEDAHPERPVASGPPAAAQQSNLLVHTFRDTHERDRFNMTSQPDQYDLEVFDSNSMDWLAFPIEQLGRSLNLKPFTFDPDTGMSCMLLRYDAGFIKPWHTHDCAHGMFVLSGTLRTHEGDFGPGSFVWFPEGMTMYHGATEDSDCLLLFITNKPFTIRYTFENEPSGSEAERLGREKACLCSMASVT
jgi:quercetin dioxygenase-like cupin family protein